MGSNPARDAKKAYKLYVYGLFYSLSRANMHPTITTRKWYNELDQDLAICKQKRIAIPPVDFDPQRAKKELSELRIAAEKKETTEKELYNNHIKIRAIVSSRTTDVEQWRNAVTLSKRQSELIEECKRNKWPISTAQYGKPELIAKQYQHYLYMMETDAIITREMGSLSSNKQYKQFFEHCALQENNISLCVQNGWWIPQLTNQDPSNLSNAFHAKKNKKDKRRRVKRWMLLFVLIIIALAALVLYGIKKYRSGKVVIPFSASYAVGQDLDSVYSQLHEAGFQNITKKSDNSGWYKDNEVRSVTIDNSEKYSQGSYRTPDVSIVITYSSSNRVYVTDLLKGWKTKEYSVVENLLRDAGFTNITLKPVTTTDKGKENSTAELSLNGLNYTNEYCYLPISAPVIISYYTLQIGIGNDSSEFIGQNYETVVNDLRESGFTNIQTQEVTTGWAKENTVVGVTVNNVDTYSSGDLFAPDVKIVVKYSSGNRVDVSDIVKKWQTADYEELVRALKSKGFSTIKVVEKTTETKTQNRLVSSISFDNAEYIAGECYLQKTASIRIEYYSLRIKISHTAKDFENSDLYSAVVSKLKNMGFTNIRLKRANDLVTGWVSKEGTIKTITINGRNDFSTTDSFKYDVEIIIVVHTFKNKGCEDITEIAD